MVDRVSDTSESAKGSGVLSLPSEPGTVPKDLGVSQQTLTGPLVCASSTEPGPVPKALNDPETGTGGQPDTKSACTPPTNTKDSETQEENTSREVNTSQEVEEKAMPLKPLEDNLINLLNEAKDHLCIYYAFIFCIYLKAIAHAAGPSFAGLQHGRIGGLGEREIGGYNKYTYIYMCV